MEYREDKSKEEDAIATIIVTEYVSRVVSRVVGVVAATRGVPKYIGKEVL